MPKYTQQKKEYCKARVRALMAQKPTISAENIREELLKTSKPLKLDKNYIYKLQEEIYKERAERNDNYTVKQRLEEFREKKEKIDEELWNILYDKKTSEGAKNAAAKQLIDNEKNLLNAEMDAGIFKRDLGRLETESMPSPLPKDQRRKVLQAFVSWGLIGPIQYDQKKQVAKSNTGPKSKASGKSSQ